MAVNTGVAVGGASVGDGIIAQLVKTVNSQAAAIDVLTAQLDADAGVTDTDYATNVVMDTIAYSNGQTPS